VDRFGDRFADVRTRGVTEGDDFVTSPSDEVILHSIRRRYLTDATLAIVLVGATTWTRRFVDWELAAALDPAVGRPLPVLALDLDDAVRRLPPRLACAPANPARVRVPDTPAALRSALDSVDAATPPVRPLAIARRPLMRTDIVAP